MNPPSPAASRSPAGELLRCRLAALDHDLARRFARGVPMIHLLRRRALGIARLLIAIWQTHLGSAADAAAKDGKLALIAVGGFGRGELHPHSDLDLLILHRAPEPPLAPALEVFIRELWDAGLTVGHSVRGLDECLAAAAADVQWLTNLMEARLLAGDRDLFAALQDGIAPEKIWSPAAYFAAKRAEQQARHERFDDAVGNLEPNLKEGPGGLRDLQNMTWVARRRFGAPPLLKLQLHGLLTARECTDLIAARDELWRLRWALHTMAGRAEERLLFDYQRSLATLLDDPRHLPEQTPAAAEHHAVERFMQRYYQAAQQLERLNERVLQQYDEEFFRDRAPASVEPLNERFNIRNGYLAAADEQIFVRTPLALLELFTWLQKRPEIAGVRASTIRLVRQHLKLIDDDFRADAACRDLFLSLLDHERRVYACLMRLNRYGILAALLPPFANIVGRMQFDLFHVYTVDQHTLFVIRNLRRILRAGPGHPFARARPVFDRIERPAVLYLAALFHDIAKGRGGDHSRAGALDAEAFCAGLALTPAERRLVVWLVRHHLLLSRTAQREDIADPEVVRNFARRVGDEVHLDHLYLLTVADIAATSPLLWNSWRDSLTFDLYQAAGRELRRGLDVPLDHDLLRAELVEEAKAILAAADCEAEKAERWWRRIPSRALLRLKAEQLAWLSSAVLGRESREPVVAIRTLEREKISELMLYAADFDGLFAAVAAVLDRMRCNVLAARIITTEDGRALDLFQITDRHGQALYAGDGERLTASLSRLLAAKIVPPPSRLALPRRLRAFAGRPLIEFGHRDRTTLELECLDFPGLLSVVSGVLADAGVRVHDARIATFGERAEDLFTLSDAAGRPLDAALCAALTERLHEKLGERLINDGENRLDERITTNA